MRGRPGPDHPIQRMGFWQRQPAPSGQLPPFQVAYREALLGPGDAVEVVGVLVREVHPDAPADGAGRSPRLRLRLRPGRLLPVSIRKVRVDIRGTHHTWWVRVRKGDMDNPTVPPARVPH